MKKHFIYSIFIVFVLLLIGCSTDTDSNSTNNVGSNNDNEVNNENNENNNENNNSGEEEEDKTLTVGVGVDMITFDIHDHLSTATEMIHDNIFNSLFKFNSNQEIEPDLVLDYRPIDDVTWEFSIKENIIFHNGDPFTSEDVKYTLERVATDDTLSDHSNYNQISEVEIVDEYNFKIITHNPEPALLNRLARLGSGMLPKNYIEENGWDHFLSEPVGTGPYKFVEWIRDDRITLEAYGNYFAGAVDEWEEVNFRVIPENSTRVSELLTGGIDIALNIPPTDWDRINENDGTSTINNPINRTMFLILRQTEEVATSDKRVREAIDLAIDNQGLIDTVLGGSGVPTKTRISPGNFGSNPNLFDTYEYDPEKAKELLEEAGYEDGFEITFQSPSGRYQQDTEVAEVIAGMLSEVGIKANIEFMEWSNFLGMVGERSVEGFHLTGVGISLFDAALGMNLYPVSYSEGYRNEPISEELEDLIDQAATNMDFEEREKQYHRVQEIVAEELPHIYLYQEEITYGYNERINFNPRIDEMIRVRDIIRN